MDEIVRLRIGDLQPTQPDDGVLPISDGPISVYRDRGKICVLHGHHRYYDAREQNGIDGMIDAVWKPNPYTNW